MRKQRERATLVFHEKLSLNSGLVSERTIWRVQPSDRYPSGLKYRLALADPKDHMVVLLYDNHWPKGPHIHWNGEERPYVFETLERLLLDFIQESAIEERRYDESKKDRY